MRRHRKHTCMRWLGRLTLVLWASVGLAQSPLVDPALRFRLAHEALTTEIPVCLETTQGWAAAGFYPLSGKPGWQHGRVSVVVLRDWMGDPGIRRMEASRLLHPLLDQSLADIGALEVHAGALGMAYTGAGVLIGLVDSGIDWRHPDFIGTGGATRIAAIWDQTDETGTPPTGFGYGSFYNREAIQAALDGTGPEVGGMDTWGHGTHMAGIAAGNGRGTGNGQPAGRYVGVAPEADLVIVKSGNGQFIEAWILDGIRFCFEYGESLTPSKAVSVNLSVGSTHQGPHDGTSTFESAIQAMLVPAGRCVTVAAGNDGDRAIHFAGDATLARGDTVAFEIQNNVPGQTDYLGFEIWSDHWSSQLRVALVTPAGDTLGPVDPQTVGSFDRSEGSVYVDHFSTGIETANNAYRTWIRLGDTAYGGLSQDNLATGQWQLLFSGQTASFHGWLYDASVAAFITQGASFHTLLPEPANSHFALTVGSYITRLSWPSLQSGTFPGDIGALSAFSSVGPTRDDRQKPDLTAPGEYIVSSRSQMGEWPGDVYVAQDSLHRAWSGTSMAAPYVAGAAALLFQMDPSLNSSQIKTYLTATARKDDWTGADPWHPGWGRGKLDVLEALRKAPVQEEDRPTLPEGVFLSEAYPNPFNPVTRLDYALDIASKIHVEIYDVCGRLVRRLVDQHQAAGRFTCAWNGLDDGGRAVPSGLYLARLSDGVRQKVRKLTLVR